MGERRFLATTAATLARAIAAQGPSRYDEAIGLIAMSQEAAADDDLTPQTITRGLRARILADRGSHREAEQLQSPAPDLVQPGDRQHITGHGGEHEDGQLQCDLGHGGGVR